MIYPYYHMRPIEWGAQLIWLSICEGLPRPVVYTEMMMTSFDAAELMLGTESETINDHFRNSRCYAPLSFTNVN